jgi:hypothetical protein
MRRRNLVEMLARISEEDTICKGFDGPHSEILYDLTASGMQTIAFLPNHLYDMRGGFDLKWINSQLTVTIYPTKLCTPNVELNSCHHQAVEYMEGDLRQVFLLYHIVRRPTLQVQTEN